MFSAPTVLPRRFVLVLGLAALSVACAQLPGGFQLPAFGPLESTSTSQESHTSSSEVTEEVNGRSVRDDDEDEDDDAPKKKKKSKKSRARAEAEEEEEEAEDEAPVAASRSKKKEVGEDIGATCQKNDECSARACFVGNGNIGYCTKMCNSWSDCPSHWECKKPGNAPQRICMQDTDD
jgi:Skp family chaperone for outer membrane proteins